METAALGGLDPRPDPRWREIDLGRWEGLTRGEVHERFPEEVARIAAGDEVKLGGGESWQDLTDRIGRALAELVSEVPDDSRVLLLTHGGVIHAAVEAGFALIGHALTDDAIRRLGPLGNASITDVAFGPGVFQLRSFNDVTHLDGDYTDGAAIALIRHGESEANVTGRWHGRTDGPLSDRGRVQAAALGARYPRVNMVYASPLQRARATAEAFAAPHRLSVSIRDDLVEIDFGAWEDMTFAEISARHPEEWSAVFEAGHDLPRGGTGETFAAAGRRLAAAIDDIAAHHSGQRIALVSHGGLIWAASARILGIDWRAWRSLAIPGNASVTHVRVVDGSAVLADYNTGRWSEDGIDTPPRHGGPPDRRDEP